MIGGGFLGGGISIAPAGKALIYASMATEDGANISNAVFKAVRTGSTVTVNGNIDGRAELLVDAGHTYTVTVTPAGGSYLNNSQTVVTASAKSYAIKFYLYPAKANETSTTASLNALNTSISSHVNKKDNPHAVTKSQVGLGSYPTSPADIGISTATQTALNGKADKTEVSSGLALKADKTYVDTEIANIDIPSPTIAGIEDLRLYNGELQFFNGTDWITIISGNFPVGATTNFDGESPFGDDVFRLTWSDPEDNVARSEDTGDEIVIGKWAGTKIVEKKGEYPADETDGRLVVDNNVRNQYYTTPLTIDASDYEDDMDVFYHYKAFPYTNVGVRTEQDVQGIKLSKFSLPPHVNCSSLLTMYKDDTTLIESPMINAMNCTSLSRVFYGCSNLVTVGYIHCPNATDINRMFMLCQSLTTIPMLDTSSVTNMESMFYYCLSLTTIPLLNISSVTNMKNMFGGCSSLTSVTLQCADVRPYGERMFISTPIESGNGYIFVPDSLVQAYRTASEWSAHASVIFGHSDKENMTSQVQQMAVMNIKNKPSEEELQLMMQEFEDEEYERR